ncbi:MarR family transcriptional regulator [Kribbella sp. NPDC023855]|uniref:MarR family winged helix-turn-helix transcriptional regulator n=1 Tax=Kribbella sp. NPDC023855 TaxID=3154698 RepID=UPI0033CCB720
MEGAIGTRLRHVLELLDGDVAKVYVDLGVPEYRPRFSPIVRTLVADGPLSIRALATAVGVTHSAASQTVAQLNRSGFVTLERGADARQRIVHLTEKTRDLLPVIEAEWQATTAALAELDEELSVPLGQLLDEVVAAVERRPFHQRIGSSGIVKDKTEGVANP